MPSVAFLLLALGMGAHLELEGVVEQYVHHSQDSLGATQEAVRLLSEEETELLRMSLTKCVDPECSSIPETTTDSFSLLQILFSRIIITYAIKTISNLRPKR